MPATRSKGFRVGPKLAQFLRFAFGAVFMVAVMTGLIASGALEKPDGSKMRLVDVYVWAFGHPANDPDVRRLAPLAITIPDAGPPPAAASEAAKPPPPPPQPPADQVQFEGIVKRFAASYVAAPNPPSQRKVRSERAAALCEQMKVLTITDWFGTVKSVGGDPAGNGSVVIDAGGMQIGTAPSAATDGSNHTMIIRDSILAGWLNNLKAGQPVQFSGGFFSDRQDCLKQVNTAAKDAVTMPQYLMKFAALKGF